VDRRQLRKRLCHGKRLACTEINMKFGTVAADLAGGGTVVISPSANTRTISGQLVDLGSAVIRGKFKITGDPNTLVVNSKPSTIVIKKGTTAQLMTISNLTRSTSNPVKQNKNESFIVNVEYQ
jgi:hypothetical protein